jgi:hypothetical protein
MRRLPALHDQRCWNWLTTTGVLAVVVAGLMIAPTAAGRAQVPVFDESALCNGQPVAPVAGALQLDSSCVLNLSIIWPHGMKQAYLEFSSDGGASWQKDAIPLVFPRAPDGLVSGVAFGACDAGLPTGTYLFRAHGFRSPNNHGDVFSAPFPDSVSLTCA